MMISNSRDIDGELTCRPDMTEVNVLDSHILNSHRGREPQRATESHINLQLSILLVTCFKVCCHIDPNLPAAAASGST